METRANYALIGAFVILSAIAALGFTLWLGQSQFRQEFDVYDIVFPGPVALEDGASVRYIGIKVGEVQSVRIERSDASKVRARIRIDSQTPVKTDSTATIELAGITGVTFVQINAGTADAAVVERRAGESVPVIQAGTTQFSEIFATGQELMVSASETMERVDALLNEENIERLSVTIANIEALSAKLAEDDGLIDNATVTLESINAAGQSFDDASRALGDVGRSAEAQLGSIGERLSRLVDDMRGVVSSSEQVISESALTAAATRKAVEGPATSAFEDVALVSRDLRQLINRLDRLARDIEDSPERFVVGDPAPYEGGR